MYTCTHMNTCIKTLDRTFCLVCIHPVHCRMEPGIYSLAVPMGTTPIVTTTNIFMERGRHNHLCWERSCSFSQWHGLLSNTHLPGFHGSLVTMDIDIQALCLISCGFCSFITKIQGSCWPLASLQTAFRVLWPYEGSNEEVIGKPQSGKPVFLCLEP